MDKQLFMALGICHIATLFALILLAVWIKMVETDIKKISRDQQTLRGSQSSIITILHIVKEKLNIKREL